MRALLAAAAAAGILSIGAAGCSDSEGEPESTAPAAAPRAFFGVVPQNLLTDADLDRMEEGNVGTIRFVIPWGAIDASAKDDELDFSTIDPVVLGGAERGIRVLPMVYGTPGWVAEELDGYSCDPGCGSYAPRSEEALAAWKEFIAILVERYGPEGELWASHPDVEPTPVRVWQIWNEQNSPTFYQPEVDPAAYAAVLESASEAITARDPGAEIVLGGMFGTPGGEKEPDLFAWNYLRRLYATDGAAESFDGVAAHPYAAHEGRIESQVRLLREEIAAAGDDASMWITEVGSSSDEGPNPLERGPEGQAEQLRTSFDFFLSKREQWDIQAVTWYSWRDNASDPNQCDWCPGSGLFEQDSLTAKPAWEAYVSFSGGS